ncbi:uncharacterized protein [Coffea arabica]|uniref:Uncharacterized protein n=1 Tax=Coffea arabica TaxID=13443 RepID=A0ABM4VX41_COFAR
MDAFREGLRDASLYDPGFRDARYTWARGRSPTRRICERLDKAVASPKWSLLFPTTMRRKRKTHKFEQLWLGDEECERILVDNWHRAGAEDPVASLVSCTQQALTTL